MSSLVQFWLLIGVLAFGTWAMRSVPIMLHGHVPYPPWLERVLRHWADELGIDRLANYRKLAERVYALAGPRPP